MKLSFKFKKIKDEVKEVEIIDRREAGVDKGSKQDRDSMFSVCGFLILTAANCVAVVIGDQVINPNDSDNEQAARVMATGSPVVWALMCILSRPFKGACGKFPAYLMLIASAAASARLGSVLGSKAFGMDGVGSKYVAPAAVGFAIIAAVVVFSLDCCGALGRGNTNLAGHRD